MAPSNFVDDQRFDGLYLNVAQTTRGIEPLLDTVFSFLRRKTDFFAGPPGAENGTEAAIAKVNEVLQKHAVRYQQEHPSIRSDGGKSKSKSKPKCDTGKVAATKQQQPTQTETETKADEDAVIEMGKGGGFDISSSAASETVPSSSSDVGGKSNGHRQSTTATQPPAATAIPPENGGTSDVNSPLANPAAAADTTNDDDDKAAGDESSPSAIVDNGTTVPGRYVWTQTLSELSVNITVPDNTRGRDLNVAIDRNHLKASLRSTKQVLVDAPLTKTIICDDSFWTVEDGNRLAINLQKLNGMEWWDSVCKDDPVKIDITKIQPESSKLNDLDGDARKTVEKMMYDQRQKAMGLPSSDEEAKLAALERFKQQHPEMDFSNAKIS